MGYEEMRLLRVPVSGVTFCTPENMFGDFPPTMRFLAGSNDAGIIQRCRVCQKTWNVQQHHVNLVFSWLHGIN